MAKKIKNKAPREHKIMNKPILALFLMPLWCVVITNLFGGVLDAIGISFYPAYTGGLGVAIVSLICLAIHKGWFRGEFDGNLKFKNLGKGLLLLLPSMAFIVTNLMNVDFSLLTTEAVILAFFSGLGPGVFEEVAFRGLAGSNFMRVWHDGKKVVLAVTLTSLLFGAVHLLNILAGAGVAISITQAVYAFGIGVIFSAVYFRTGSLIPTMIAHTLVDSTAFLNAEVAANGGVLTDSGFDPSMIAMGVAGIALMAIGYYYVISPRSEKVLELWAKKWKRNEPVPGPEAHEAEETADTEKTDTGSVISAPETKDKE